MSTGGIPGHYPAKVETSQGKRSALGRMNSDSMPKDHRQNAEETLLEPPVSARVSDHSGGGQSPHHRKQAS